MLVWKASSVRSLSIPLRCIFGRQNSTNSSIYAPKRRPSFVIYGVLGGGAVATAYFFWPDISRSAPTYSNALLSPVHFIPVTVSSTVACADPNSRLITLTVPPQCLPSRDESAVGPVWSIFIKDDDIQVERPYTPLEGIDKEGRMKFWIKKYPKGEVGRWVHSKNVGDKIEIRGPLVTWKWQENVWDEVVMISGGTGITPFCQLLYNTVLQNPSNPRRTRFTLLHGSYTPAELPPPAMLEPLLSTAQTHPDRFKMSLFVNSLDGPSHPSLSSSAFQVGRIDRGAIEHALGIDNGFTVWWKALLRMKTPADRTKKTLFLVCGPESMINSIAGPFGRNFSQGSIGGVLQTMGYGSHEVWKL
ncbi:ferredoxin reductase-like protein [Sparassis latifolia]|uniref:Ferredoxin reductase-like C-terminal NADP-linked domain-containing protein n=1 Tax=Sparassis crispa TaxID=139825 RepID=A0A401GBU0_9APHY|nr:ferredoxin reductase-like C-terminal NADP-linked domain-containing protein [Sparassis crispa]GBE79644.1 ferredoxin reductase-like C-terminal NADP-linked domain-containing protein [Sparassis crispa]